MKFFIWVNDQQQGPHEEGKIRQLVLEGQIARDTLACPEGNNSDWSSVGELLFNDSKLKSLGMLSNSLANLPLAKEVDRGFRLDISLNSGRTLKVKAIRLFDETEIAKLNNKKAEVAKLLQGVSTGLGAIGSIGWVLAASAVISATEAALSAGATSVGIKLLKEVVALEEKIRAEGAFSYVGNIAQIDNPIPSLWCVAPNESKSISNALIHNGDDFLCVITDDDLIQFIRWSAVECYVHCRKDN